MSKTYASDDSDSAEDEIEEPDIRIQEETPVKNKL